MRDVTKSIDLKFAPGGKMQYADQEQGMHGDSSFFAQLPAVLLAGAAIVAILIVNQPSQPSAHVDATKSDAVEMTLPAGAGGNPSKAVKTSVAPV